MLNQQSRQRLVVVLIDGLGLDYYEQSPMPVLHQMAENGYFRRVQAVLPTVTNVNNVSVCCGGAKIPPARGIYRRPHGVGGPGHGLR
jgi:hypothetical protein